MTTINNPNAANQNWQNFMDQNLFPISSSTMNNMIDLIKYPIITEKSYLALFKNQQYTFDVDLRLSKPQIKKLFENLFNVNVIAVNTHIPPRKNMRVGTTQGYRVRYKRAILTLKKGQSLKFSIPLTGFGSNP
uniref:Large ribosomal subunit protein uL23c n=1 Tax=Chloromonas radiata TaxID=47907 RepID=A0A0S2ICH7_9CHLO|nr:ribosomal protein L23 [Chloromonas radiata]